MSPKVPTGRGVLLAGLAPAVAAPVAEGFGDLAECGVAGQHGAAFAHGDVMGGVEGQRGEVAEGAHLAALPGGAEGVAAVFHQPQAVGLGEGTHGIEVEGVAEGVGDHDRLGARREGRFEHGHVDVVAG